MEAARSIMGKTEQVEKEKEKKISPIKEDLAIMLASRIQDNIYISSLTSFSKEQIRNMRLKYASGRDITQDYRGEKNNLTKFITNL